VAVLDFAFPRDPSGGVLARQATDAVVLEMTRTGRFDVMPRAQVLRRIEELGLPVPLDVIAIRKLGQALGADYVATGARGRLGVLPIRGPSAGYPRRRADRPRLGRLRQWCARRRLRPQQCSTVGHCAFR
jgi:hypothetical protein